MPNVKTSQSRVWLIEDGAGPANVPEYLGRARARGVSWDTGDRTPVREPDPGRYGAFKTVDAIKGEASLPGISLEARYQFAVSRFLELARKRCLQDVQLHMGECEDPRDFNRGWKKIAVFEQADISNYATDDLGALNEGDNSIPLETIDLNALDFYEVTPLLFSEQAASQIVQQILDVVICDSVTCGACGIPSDGCQRVFALTTTAGGSPGLPAELVFTEDGGATWQETLIDTLAVNENPIRMSCVGINLVIVSANSCSIHYAPIADILTNSETWVELATGLVCPTGAPNAIFSLGSANTWLVGAGGYVYFSSDITAGFAVQSAGSVTTQPLNDIHGIDEDHLVAVGNSNAVIYTRNGGSTWASVTGPLVGATLRAVWMKGINEWFVGTGSVGNGRLYYTRDAGASWVEKVFSGSGSASSQVRDIRFATPTVGYMTHSFATPSGRLLRTIDGGNSWYVLPEGTGAIPDNDIMDQIAAVAECPNVVYSGGLAANGTDGFLVKAA